jgi:hypothetical protein
MRSSDAIAQVLREYTKITNRFAPFNSTHEAYGVLAEEVDELWDEVKANNTPRMVEEAIQVAAVALRIVAEFGAGESNRGGPSNPLLDGGKLVTLRNPCAEVTLPITNVGILRASVMQGQGSSMYGSATLANTPESRL